MRDEAFAEFIARWGEPTARVDVPNESLQTYRDKLPPLLLSYWREEGWSTYRNGLLWTVDPSAYEDVLDTWLEDTGIDEVDSFHVIARSAFGHLYACGERTGRSVTVSCPTQAILALPRELRPKSLFDRDLSIESFFAMREPASVDLEGDDGKPLFERARRSLGDLAPDEMYGFEPAIAAGGTMALGHLRKVQLDAHLSILRQLADPVLPMARTDIDRLKG